MIDEKTMWEALGSAGNNWLDRDVAEGFFAEVRERMARIGSDFETMRERDQSIAPASGDLVERLRNCTRSAATYDLTLKAADEIERLRAQLAAAEAEKQDTHRILDKWNINREDYIGDTPWTLGDRVARLLDDYSAAEARLASAVKALEFYADGRRYDGPNQRPLPDDPYANPDEVYIRDVTRDRGKIALAALRSLKLDGGGDE